MTKRIFALLLAVLMGISCFALTACGGEEDKPAEPKNEDGDSNTKEPVSNSPETTVTEEPPVVVAPTITLFESAITVVIGEETFDIAMNSYATPTDAALSYAVADSSIATVSEAGVVEGVAEGTTTVTVTATAGDQTATAELSVTVEKPFEPETETDKAIFGIMRDESIPKLTTLGWYSVNVTSAEGGMWNYDELESATAGPVEIWSAADPHLQFLFTFNNSEINAAAGLDTPDTYDYWFDFYLKPYDEETANKGGYNVGSIQAWSAYQPAGEGVNYIYRCTFYDALYKPGYLEEGVEYIVKVVVRQGETVKGWADSSFTWTDSCESFVHYAENNTNVVK